MKKSRFFIILMSLFVGLGFALNLLIIMLIAWPNQQIKLSFHRYGEYFPELMLTIILILLMLVSIILFVKEIKE